jgi:hypothetical protein
MTTPNTTPEAVERYFLSYHHTQTYAEMLPDCDGDWVRYSDYAALRAEVDRLRGAKLSTGAACECGMTSPCMWGECKHPIRAALDASK